MMKKKPDSRFQDCQAVFEELSRWLAGQGETVVGSMYATIAQPGQGSDSSPADQAASETITTSSEELSAETRALVESLETAANQPLEPQSPATSGGFAFEVSSEPTNEVVSLDVPVEDSSVLASRRQRSTIGKKSGIGVWIGIMGVFFGLLIALLLVLMFAL